MKDKNLSLYSSSLGQEYIKDCNPCDNLRHDDREKIRSIQVLDDYLNLGRIRIRTTVPVKHHLYGEIGVLMQKLIDHLHSLRRSLIIIEDYELYLNRFLAYLHRSEVYTLNELKERHILEFVPSKNLQTRVAVLANAIMPCPFWQAD